MNPRLINYAIDNFLDKYTRFMTKDIYISFLMYKRFLEQYKYLYDDLLKERDFYSNNKKYLKVMDIFSDDYKLVRLHNQKYLNRVLKKKRDSLLDLDLKSKMIVFMDEENTYVVDSKNYVSLVREKIRYLIDSKKYRASDILVLGKSGDYFSKFRGESLFGVDISSIEDYGEVLFSNRKIIDDRKKYSLFSDYILNNLFLDKVNFESFYNAFSRYIYINKDYKDFDTFRDYHRYMYKRKFLASNLSLKKFNEGEIKKRRGYLRTINNEILSFKEEVDIANFLFLNSIEYDYDSNVGCFLLNNNNFKIKYVSERENTYIDGTIYIDGSDKSKKCLEVLGYELVKNRISMELVSDNDIYDRLRDTNVDNYFSEFINKYLLPLVDYYDMNNDFIDVKISDIERVEFLKLYSIYLGYLDDNNYYSKRDILSVISDSINNSNYKYLFLIGDIDIDVNIKTFNVVKSYGVDYLFNDSVKLLYDYKNYLYSRQIIPIMDTFINKEELDLLTREFVCNKLFCLDNNIKMDKVINILEYDDSNRFRIYSNISNNCYKILLECSSNTLIGLSNFSDINILVDGCNFNKIDKNTLSILGKDSILVEEILKIDKCYDNIILPYIIKDCYHESLFFSDVYNVKIMLYRAFSKCRDSLIILWPSSRIGDVGTIFSDFVINMI